MIHADGYHLDDAQQDPLNWNLYTEGEPEMGGWRMFYPWHSRWAGNSSSNAMCYLRDIPPTTTSGRRSAIQAGRLRTCCRTSSDRRTRNGASPYHGTGGPLNVADLQPQPVTDVFIDAGLETGPRVQQKDFNGESPEGVGPFQVTQKGGRRCSTARGYLKPVRSRQNLTVITDASRDTRPVRRQARGRRRYRHQGALRKVGAEQEVILSAGAIQSPRL